MEDSPRSAIKDLYMRASATCGTGDNIRFAIAVHVGKLVTIRGAPDLPRGPVGKCRPVRDCDDDVAIGSNAHNVGLAIAARIRKLVVILKRPSSPDP